jgi:hypothetical protein
MDIYGLWGSLFLGSMMKKWKKSAARGLRFLQNGFNFGKSFTINASFMSGQSPKSVGLREFWEELGYSRTTFYRRLSSAGLKTPNRLLSPEEQDKLRAGLGFPPKFYVQNRVNDEQGSPKATE